MPQDTNQIRVGANGKVLVAPVGTTAPADYAASWPAGWIDLGYTSEDGVKISDSKDMEEIEVWQLFYAARRVITKRDFTLEFTLRQWSKYTVPLAFGGGTISAAGGGYKYSPPSAATIDERAMGIEFVDNTTVYRFIVPRGLVSDAVETSAVRNAAADLPIKFGIIGQASVDPYTILTNDPAFA